jgi:hypothetical protein
VRIFMKAAPPGSSSPARLHRRLRTERSISDILPIGPTILVQHDDAARLYDAVSGALVRELATGPLSYGSHGLALYRDGTSVVVTTPVHVAVFDLATGHCRDRIDVAVATGAVVAPSGRILFLNRLQGSAEVALSSWAVGEDPVVVARLGYSHNCVGLALGAGDTHAWLSLSSSLARVDLAAGAVWSSPREERCRDTLTWLASSGCVAVGTLDGAVQFWRDDDAPSLQGEVRVGPQTLHAVRVASLRKGALVAATTVNQQIAILAAGDIEPRVFLEGPRAPLEALVSDGEAQLWVSAADGTLWHVDVSEQELPPPAKAVRKGRPKFPLTNHPTSQVSALQVVAPGKAVSADLDGGLCVWERGFDDARAYRRPKADRSLTMKYAIHDIAVAGPYIVVREGAAGFVVLDAATLGLVTKLAHQGASTARADGTTLVTTGGTLIQSFRLDTWERLATRDGLAAGTCAEEWIAALRAISFRDERGVVGLIGVDDLTTQSSRSFADAKSPGMIAVDRAGTCLAFDADDGAGTFRRRVRLWELATGRLTLLAPDAPAGASDSSPRFVGDGLLVMSHARGAEVVASRITWFGLDGTPRRHLDLGVTPVSSAPAVCEAAREDVLVVSVQGGLEVIDASTGALRARHTIDARVAAVALDGERVVVLTDGGRVTWLDLHAEHPDVRRPTLSR